jgi:hypothetical protein
MPIRIFESRSRNRKLIELLSGALGMKIFYKDGVIGVVKCNLYLNIMAHKTLQKSTELTEVHPPRLRTASFPNPAPRKLLFPYLPAPLKID